MHLTIVLAITFATTSQVREPAEVKSPANAEAELLRELLGEIDRLADLRFPSIQEGERLEVRIAELVELFPEEPAARLWAGKWAERQGMPAEAHRYWEQAIDQRSRIPGFDDAPFLAESCQLLGESALSGGDPDDARRYARQALSLVPYDPRSFRILIDAAFRSGNIGEPLREIREAYREAGGENLALALFYFDLLADVGDWKRLNEALDAEPAERSRHFHLFRARLAALERNDLETMSHLLLGHWNGDTNRFVTRECRNRLDPFLRADPEALSEELRMFVQAFFAIESPDRADELLPWFTDRRGGSPAQQSAIDHFTAAMFTETGDLDEGKRRWRKILDSNPRYLPAIVSLGEILQATGEAEQADRLFDEARSLSTANFKTLELDRLGGKYELAENGVRIRSVEEGSYLHQFGLRAGDLVLRLDRETLADMPPFARLRKMRLFQGGTVQYESPDGRTHEREMELILFGF